MDALMIKDMEYMKFMRVRGKLARAVKDSNPEASSEDMAKAFYYAVLGLNAEYTRRRLENFDAVDVITLDYAIEVTNSYLRESELNEINNSGGSNAR